LPYEGQHDPKVLTKTAVETPVVKETIPAKTDSSIKTAHSAERKKVSAPSGKLNSTIIGIKSTLNPREKKKLESEEVSAEMNESYTIEQLQHFWKEYALGVKREKKDSLFATLIKSEFTVNSNHLIKIKIQNSVQSQEIDLEKGNLVRFLRNKLQNSNINLEYEMDASETAQILDSKSKFDKLAEENSSLNKFRKLFNLDIEF
jgi:hypothetical protein